MPKKYYLYAILLGATVGLIVASAMSFLDWRHNPGGIFHSDLGTNWQFVWDTWISWFTPVCVTGSAVSVLVFFWLAKRKKLKTLPNKTMEQSGNE